MMSILLSVGGKATVVPIPDESLPDKSGHQAARPRDLWHVSAFRVAATAVGLSAFAAVSRGSAACREDDDAEADDPLIGRRWSQGEGIEHRLTAEEVAAIRTAFADRVSMPKQARLV
jgi:hypothetical protein